MKNVPVGPAHFPRGALVSAIVALWVALASCGGGGSSSNSDYRPDTGGGSYTYFRGLDAIDSSLLIHDAKSTRDGGAVLTGERIKDSQRTLFYRLAEHSLAVVRVGSDGNRLWAREIGGGSAAGYSFIRFKDAAQTADGGYLLAGDSLSGATLAKLSGDRRVLWQRQFPRDDYYRYIDCILPLDDGGAVLAGTVTLHSSRGGRTSWLWLVRIDAQGMIVQERLDLEELGSPIAMKRHGGSAYIIGANYIADFDALDLARAIQHIPVDHPGPFPKSTVDALAFDRTGLSQAQGYFLAKGDPLESGAYNYGDERGIAVALERIGGDEQWRESTPIEEGVIYRAFAPDPDTEHILAAIERRAADRSWHPALRYFERIDAGEFTMNEFPMPAPPAGMPAAGRLLGLVALPSGDHLLYGGTPDAEGEQMLWVGLMERQTRRMLWTNRIDVPIHVPGRDDWNTGATHRLVAPARPTDDGGLLLTFARHIYKLDNLGALEFTLPRMNESGESGASVIETAQGDFLIAAGNRRASITGEPQGASLLRLRPDGSLRWRRLLPDYELARALVVMEDDETGVLLLDADQGLVVMNLDSEGAILWRSNLIRTGCTQCFRGLLATRDGGLLAYSAARLIKFGPAGTEQWSRLAPAELRIDAVTQTPDGDYLLSGQRTTESEITHPMLARFAGDGSGARWIRSYEIEKHPTHSVSVVPSVGGGATLVTSRLVDSESEGGRCFIMPPNQDNLYEREANLSGIRACSDIVALRVDDRGDVIWQRSYGTAGIDFATGAAATADNGILAWGRTDAFGYPYFGTALLRTDADGNVASIVTGSDGQPISACPVSLGARLSAPAIGEPTAPFTPVETRAGEITYARVTESDDLSTGDLELFQARACLAQNQAPVLRVTVEGRGTVTSDPAGIDCGEDCEQAYATGTDVTLTATPMANATFEGWDGGCAFLGNQNPASLPLFSDRDCTARFSGATTTPPPSGVTYELIVSGDGNTDQLRLTAPDLDCAPGQVCAARYPAGVAVRIAAAVDPGYFVSTWVGCDSYTRDECTVIVRNNRSVVAFVNQEDPARPQLHVARVDAGSGDIQGLQCRSDYGCSGTFDRGEEVTITAMADAGSVFHGWIGCPAPGAYGTCVVTMSENRFLMARFARIGQARLTVLRTGASIGAVHVTSDRPGIDCGVDCIEDYPDYTRVRLTPTATTPTPVWSNCDFVHPDNSCEVELMADRTVEIHSP